MQLVCKSTDELDASSLHSEYKDSALFNALASLVLLTLHVGLGLLKLLVLNSLILHVPSRPQASAVLGLKCLQHSV